MFTLILASAPLSARWFRLNGMSLQNAKVSILLSMYDIWSHIISHISSHLCFLFSLLTCLIKKIMKDFLVYRSRHIDMTHQLLQETRQHPRKVLCLVSSAITLGEAGNIRTGFEIQADENVNKASVSIMLLLWQFVVIVLISHVWDRDSFLIWVMSKALILVHVASFLPLRTCHILLIYLEPFWKIWGSIILTGIWAKPPECGN